MIWLVGQEGLLASEIIEQFDELGFEYCATGRRLDLRNIKLLQDFAQSHKAIDTIVNCAAYTNVDKAESDREEAFALNEKAVQNLVCIANKLNATLVHFSTDYVFSGTANSPYTEDAETSPINIYGETKLAGEEIVRTSLAKYYIIRTSSLYGKNGNNFVKKIIELTNTKKEIRVISNQIACPTNAKDIAICVCLLVKSKAVPFGTYHYTNSGFVSWFDFACKIYAFAKKEGLVTNDCSIVPCTASDYEASCAGALIAKRPAFSALSSEKIQRAMNIKLKVWEESLEAFIKSIK